MRLNQLTCETPSMLRLKLPSLSSLSEHIVLSALKCWLNSQEYSSPLIEIPLNVHSFFGAGRPRRGFSSEMWRGCAAAGIFCVNLSVARILQKANDYVQNPYLRLFESRECEPDRDPRRLGAEGAQPGRHDLHRPARPLRHHADRGRGALAGRRARGRGAPGPRIRGAGHGPRARTFVEKPPDGHGRRGGHGREAHDPQRGADPALHHRGGVGRRRRPAHEVPLPRLAPCAVAAQHDPAPQDGAGDPPLPRQRGIP